MDTWKRKERYNPEIHQPSTQLWDGLGNKIGAVIITLGERCRFRSRTVMIIWIIEDSDDHSIIASYGQCFGHTHICALHVAIAEERARE